MTELSVLLAGKFTNIVAKWPGSAHDSYIFRNSNLSEHLQAENPRGEQGVLLGDGGYPCLPYLMTPYHNPTTQQQAAFNDALTATRVRIEHVFGVLKRRFHVLHGEVRMRPERVVKIISACTVLHNIAVQLKEQEPPESDSDDDSEDGDEEYDGPLNTGHIYRDFIANRYF